MAPTTPDPALTRRITWQDRGAWVRQFAGTVQDQMPRMRAAFAPRMPSFSEFESMGRSMMPCTQWAGLHQGKSVPIITRSGPMS